METKTGQQQTSQFRHTLQGTAAVSPAVTPADNTSNIDSTKGWAAGNVGRKSSMWADVVTKTSTKSGGMSSTKSGGMKRNISGQSTENLEALTTIHNVEILKGIPLCLAMGTFGKIFGFGGDPVEHMAMSKQVVKLQDFISHNWVIPRYTKWAALALHYNFKPAIIVTLAVCVCTSLLMLIGILPSLDSGTKGTRVNLNSVVGLPTFYVVLVFWQDIKRSLPTSLQLKERMTFVDKSCIHQTDKAKMIEGISSLAGFLRCSDFMVVCCGPQYFRKLWTVYEIASFLSIHRDPSRIKLYPTTWAKPLAILAIVTTFVCFLRRLATTVTSTLGLLDGSVGWALFLVLSAFDLFGVVVVYVYCLRRAIVTNEEIKKDLGAFDIRNAHCAVESDRPIVEGNVSTFMRELGRVPEHVQREEALDAFNHMVHTDFLSYIADARTEFNFSLLFQIIVFLPRQMELLDQSMETLYYDKNLPHALVWFVANLDLFHYLVLLGNTIAVPLVSRNLQLSSWRKHLYLFAIAGLLAAITWVLYVYILAPISHLDPFFALILLLPLQACLFGLTVWTSIRPCCRRRHEGQLPDVRPGITATV